MTIAPASDLIIGALSWIDPSEDASSKLHAIVDGCLRSLHIGNTKIDGQIDSWKPTEHDIETL